MYATLTIEAIHSDQELIFTPEERYTELFLGNYLKGVGISSIIKTSSDGLIDTYTITFTDNTTTTFEVTNGSDGIGISNIELVSTVDNVKTYRITFTNSSTFEYTITDGADGRGIVSFTLISTVDKTKTYRLLYTDATYVDINIIDGNDGNDGTGAYQIYVVGGGTLSEAEFNAAITLIPSHIADETIHHTIEELNEVYEPANSNIQEHIADTDIHIDSSSELGVDINESTHSLLLWNGLKSLKVTFSRLKTWIGSYFFAIGGNTFGAKKLIGSTDNQDFGIITNNTERITVTKDGNVGIGTTNPLAKFQVSGDYNNTGAGGIMLDAYPSSPDVYSLRINPFVIDSGKVGYQFQTKSVIGGVQIPLTFDNAGNVGIGTTAPKSKLQVAGGIQFGDDTAAASADKVGTIRQRDVDNKTKLEFVRNNNGTYDWEQINDKLSLDQSTPQTINGKVTINGQVDATTTDVNQSSIPSVNASQTAAILQDGSSFTGTDYVMPTNNVAVKIVASAAHTMGDFTIRVKSSATLTSTIATLTGYLYSDNAGSPGTLLATGNAIRHGSITTSYQELSLGTQYNMVSGTTYWLVVRWNSAPTGGNIILDSNVNSNSGATSQNANTWTLTNVQLRYRLRGRTYYGINSFSTNSIGVRGESTNNIGVIGFSANSYGVYGSSTNYYGVYGSSTNSIGVRGESTNNIGVYGYSTNNIGVYGSSTNNYGVFGLSTNYYGVYGSSTNSYAGYFVRNTQTPTSSVPVLYAYQQHASNTNSVFDIRQSGTGEIIRGFSNTTQTFSVTAAGLGIFAKGVQIGDNTDVASAENKGAVRYRENAGGSFCEMVMKKQDGTYAWTTIVSYQ